MNNSRAHQLSLTNRLLLGSVAASVAMLGYGRAAYAACVTDGTIITCTGDLSAGVIVTNPITTLNINSLTTNITPATDVDGINFTSTGDITVVSDTGAFAISVSGASGDGVRAEGNGASVVSVTHTGDVTSALGVGIMAYSNTGRVTTVSTGNISAGDVGISGFINGGAGAVSVTHTGDITSAASTGLQAFARNGEVTTLSVGKITARTDGINASSNGAGAVSVTHTGDITSTAGRGVKAYSIGGNVTTLSTGTIRADEEGIQATSDGAGAVSVTHTGDIISTTRAGIEANSSSGIVTTVSTGTITAYNDGINAFGNGAGSTSVTHTGDIASTNGRGIYAYSNAGNVVTVTTGNIRSYDTGIRAYSAGAGSANVAHTGDITSTANRGILAQSVGGDAAIVSTGNIVANSFGIYSRSNGGSSASVNHTGDVTSSTAAGIYAGANVGSTTITLGAGVVRGATGAAIQVNSATGTTLNLNAGSVLIGSITIGGAGAAALNTGPGLSIAHTFTGTVPTIGNVSGNVSAVVVNQIAVADISNLAATDNQLSVTLDGVSGVLETSRDRNDGVWWLSAFGGTGFSPASGNAPQSVHGFGGLVAGTHAMLGNGVQLGVFGGVSKGAHLANVTNGVRSDSNSFFGGVYGSFLAEMLSLDFALSAGASSNQGTRIVANNTVATGLETALSDATNYFFAPEFTLSSTPIQIQGVGFTPSLRVRYEVLQSGGFTETGLTSGGALTMDSATSHALNIRLQGAMPIDTGNSAQTLVARVGVDGRFATTSGRDATLLGVMTSAAGAGSEFAGGGFAGLDFTHALSDVVKLTANGEFRAGTSGISATANVGVKGAF